MTFENGFAIIEGRWNGGGVLENFVFYTRLLGYVKIG